MNLLTTRNENENFNKEEHTIGTGIIFEMGQVEHMVSTPSIVNKFFMESGVNLPQSTMNNN